MTISHNKAVTTAVGVAAAAAVVPAILFTGSGIAEATTTVTAHPGAGGVTVKILNNSPLPDTCTYHSRPISTPPNRPVPLEFHSLPFHLGPGGTTFDIPIPAIPTDSKWDVRVACVNNGDVTLTFPSPLIY